MGRRDRCLGRDPPRDGQLSPTWRCLLLALLLAACEEAAPLPEQAPALPEDAIQVVVVPAAPPPDIAGFEEQRKGIWDALRARVAQLAQAGTYNCCIKVPCSHCALMAGGCNCGPGLQRGEPVCHECALMWTRGQGLFPEIDPSSVVSFLEAEKEMKGITPRCAPPAETAGDD